MKTSFLKTGIAQVTNNVDTETGEVLSTEVKKHTYLANTKEDFMLIYSTLLSVMFDMSSSEIKLYAYFLSYYASGFTFEIGKGTRALLGKQFKMNDRSVQNTIYKLKNRNLIVSVGTNMYQMNPRYAFKGSSAERNKQLKTIIELHCAEC